MNRISHALLFLGREGAGALPLAIAFAQYLVCERNSPFARPAPAAPSLFGEPETPPPVKNATDSCGVCPSCVKCQKWAHPDVHFSFPAISRKSQEKVYSSNFALQWREFMAENPYGNVYDWLQYIEAENRQGNISTDECEDIMRKLSLKSFESPFKILILWMPEYLTKNGNRLLKLIEEPPPNTLFLLVAENEALILPTILSRTQLVRIPPIQSAELAEALVQRQGLSSERAAQVAALSEGNYREALQLAGSADENWQPLLREWLNLIVLRKVDAQIKWVEEMAKTGREKQKQFLRYFTHLLELSLRIQNGLPAEALPDEQDFALRLNKLCGFYQQEAIIGELEKADYHIERNANPKMLFQALTIKLHHVIRNNSLILMH
jgi:DNA polymerase-3 subunit delta'